MKSKILINIDPIKMERAVNYMQNPDATIDDELKELLDRWKMAYQLLNAHGSRTKVANMLVKIYGYNISTAYSDLEICEKIFSEISKSQKIFWRNWAADLLRERIIKIKDTGDAKSLAILLKELRETLGYDQDETKMPDWSEFELPEIEFGFFPELHGVPIPKDLDSHIANLALRKNNTNIQDIDHEEVPDSKEPDTQEPAQEEDFDYGEEEEAS